MDYERGLEELKQLCLGTAWENEFLTLEASLREDLRKERLYGSSLQLVRNQIVAELNRLAKERYKISFNDLCVGNLVNVYIEGIDALLREEYYSDVLAMYKRATKISLLNPLYQKMSARFLDLGQKTSARFLDLGQWNNVITICNAAISLIGHGEEPSIIAQIYVNKGEALLQIGKLEEALDAFDHAIREDNCNAELWKRKGEIYAVLQQLEESAFSYKRAIYLKSKDAVLRTEYGDVLFKLRHYAEAKRQYNEAIRIGGDVYAYKGRSNVLNALAQILEEKSRQLRESAQEDENHFNQRNR